MTEAKRIITAYTLRHLVTCERRVWADGNGDRRLRVEIDSAQAAAGISHETIIQQTMFGPVTSVPASSWDESARLTQEWMTKGVSAIQGAALERLIEFNGQTISVRGRADWLRRSHGYYEPIEIKLRGEAVEADLLQLDLYLWLLMGLQDVEVSGWLWLGRDWNNQPLQMVEHVFDERRLLRAIERAAEALIGKEKPPIFFGSHCALCPWQAACQNEAEIERDVALLPGLQRMTWEQLHEAGFHTLDRVMTAEVETLKRFKGIGKSRAQDFQTFAQAVVTRQPVRRAPLPAVLQDYGVMLDLETNIEREGGGLPWCFGWQVADGAFQVAIVDRFFEGDGFDLPDGTRVQIVPDSDSGWRLIAQAAVNTPGPVYHWGSFEMGVLRATAPLDVIEVLESRLHDLNNTFKKTCTLPVRGTSIKKVAPYLGYRWPEGANAMTAWADYRAWLLEGNRMALGRAIAYNRADVEAMALVWRWMNTY